MMENLGKEDEEFWHVSEHEPVHLSLVPLTWCVEDTELRAFFDMSLKEDLFDVIFLFLLY